ncbi:MAG TPA: hypothetical protein VGK67_11075 [Myxococcales bacterium]
MAAPSIRSGGELRGRAGAGAASLAAALVLGSLLVSAAAQARPAVTIAEFSDATRARGRADQARSAIVKAVQEADEVDVIPFSRIKSLAASRRVKDLANPKALGKVVQGAGGDAAVTASIAKAGGQVKLSLRIYDLQGVEIWEKTVPLGGGELKPTVAQRFAAAIAASVGIVGSDKPATKPASPTEPEPAAEPSTKPKIKPARGTEGSEPTTGAAEPKALGANDEPEAPLAAVPEPSRKPRPPMGGEPESPGAERTASITEEQEEELARPSWVHLNVDLSFTWRNYQYCPEVTDCAQPTPGTAGMSAVKYSTGAPYAGVLVRLDAFPLRFLDNFVRGVGLSFAYGSSLGLRTHYTEDSVDKSFESRQQKLMVEVLYRFYFRIGGAGDGWAGLRGGWLHHAFYVADNPKIVESVRSGLYGQLDVGMPLHRFLRIEAKGTLIPYASPGATERLKYGAGDEENNRPTQGGGWSVEGGLTSDFGHPEWHIGLQAMFEYAYFGDRYNNPPDVHPEFGRATENYMGFRVGLKSHL